MYAILSRHTYCLYTVPHSVVGSWPKSEAAQVANEVALAFSLFMSYPCKVPHVAVKVSWFFNFPSLAGLV